MAYKFVPYAPEGSGGGDSIVVDVESLPTENIEEGKIYRVTKESEIEFWLSTSTFNKPLTEYVLDMTKVNMTFPVHVVESLPDAMEPMDQTTFTVPCYVVESTGIAYISADGTSANANPLGSALGFPMTDGGWVDSVDDIVYPGETTVYTVRGGSSTTYGIPDEANNKTVMEHNGSGWVECGSLTGTIPVIDVTELPTENINENALYRIVSVDVFMCMGNTAVNFKEAYPNMVIHVVDTLPETPEVSGSDALVMYVLNDTGNMYVSEDGSTCISYADAFAGGLGLPSGTVLDFGWVENESMITQDGLYTIRKDARYMYHDGIFVCINEAATPQVKFVLNDNGDGYTVNGNGSYLGNVIIPNEHDGLPVTRIGSFQNCYDVLRVTIPDAVTNMDDGVFRYCPALCHVDMGSGISVIPSKAFYESRINSIKLDHITEIGEEAFAGSCIETFPHFENLITIGSKAFIDCRMMTQSNVPKSEGVSYLITSLVIPETVETIGSEAFKHTSYDEVQFLGTPTSVDSTAFSECGYLTKIFVPWAEGAVTGAPWGATNAKITYNYKQST